MSCRAGADEVYRPFIESKNCLFARGAGMRRLREPTNQGGDTSVNKGKLTNVCITESPECLIVHYLTF
jgi:hypothetical protein